MFVCMAITVTIIQSYLYLSPIKPPCTLHKILIIDDEDKLRSLLARIIRAEGFAVEEAADAKAGLQLLERQSFEVILCDVKLPDANGVELVKKLKEAAPATEVILLTAYGNIPDGVRAIQHGAFDYITKGNDNDRILPLIHRAIEKNQLRQRVENLEKRVGEKYSFDTILGQSAALRRVIELAQQGSRHRRHGTVDGRNRNGKGSIRPGDSPGERPRGPQFCGVELQYVQPRAAGK